MPFRSIAIAIAGSLLLAATGVLATEASGTAVFQLDLQGGNSSWLIAFAALEDGDCSTIESHVDLHVDAGEQPAALFVVEPRGVIDDWSYLGYDKKVLWSPTPHLDLVAEASLSGSECSGIAFAIAANGNLSGTISIATTGGSVTRRPIISGDDAIIERVTEDDALPDAISSLFVEREVAAGWTHFEINEHYPSDTRVGARGEVFVFPQSDTIHISVPAGLYGRTVIPFPGAPKGCCPIGYAPGYVSSVGNEHHSAGLVSARLTGVHNADAASITLVHIPAAEFPEGLSTRSYSSVTV